MEKIVCPMCGEIIIENPECESMGIITCEKCDKQVVWQCDGYKVVTR